MRRFAAVFIISLWIPAQLAKSAEKHVEVDFDQGPDATAVLNEARRLGGVSELKPLLPLMTIAPAERLARVVVPPSLKVNFWPPSASPTSACDAYNPESDGRPAGVLTPCAGTEQVKSCSALSVRDLMPDSLKSLQVPLGSIFGGPFALMPAASAVYREAYGVKGRVDAAPTIPDETRGKLLTDWSTIQSVGAALKGDGSGLDVDDAALYDDAVRINIWRDRINARLKIGNQLLAQYNQGCLSGPIPPDEAAACNRWADQFNACVARHNSSAQRYKQAVDIWNANYDRLEPRVTDFRTKLQNWENTLLKVFIDQANQALTSACAPLISVTASADPAIIKPQMTSLLKAEPKYGEGSQPCPTTYIWKPSGTELGFLGKPDAQSVIFTSSGQRGKQDFRVEASDGFSSKVAGTIVTIDGGKICAVRRAYDRSEDKTTCAYECARPRTISYTGDVPCPQVFDPE